MSRRPKPPDPKIAVGYIRVSTDEQKLGPEAQRHALRSWAERCDVVLVAIHEDLGIGGSMPIDARPGLVAALGDVAKHRAGALVVARLDRLARDALVVEQIARELERRGAHLVSERGEGTGDSDPSSTFMRQVMAAAAQHEREIIRARTKGALAVMKRDGKRVGQIPYGYRLAADGVHLEQDPDEAEVVRAVTAWRRSGATLRAIVSRLNSAAVPARGRRWHLTSVQRILARDPGGLIGSQRQPVNSS